MLNLKNFDEILLCHFEKYPLMRPQDAVKLVYQSAFGCGHLVKNRETAMSMLKNEMESINADEGDRLFVPIGGGYVRLDLYSAKAKGISYEKICDIFMESANSGEKTSFEEKLEILKKLANEGKTPFGKDELSEYLSGYNGEAVSHSSEYRLAYTPSYRVIFERLAEDLQ